MSKAMTIEELKKNGWFEHDGKQYVLLQQAYIDGTTDEPYYTATAICTGDQPDEDGWQPCYSVTWNCKDDFLEYVEECNKNGDYCDEGDACDWEHPASVTTMYREYSLAKNYIA